MASYCAKGGKVVDKAWVPLGTKDYASVIAKIPKDVDALVVVLGGSDAVNFLTQYEQAGGNKPMIGGSITVDQTVLNYKGKRRDSLLGTASAGPMADSIDTPGVEEVRRRLQGQLQGRLPEPVAVRLPATTSTPRRRSRRSMRSRATSRTGRRRTATALQKTNFKGPAGDVKIDANRNGVGTTYITEVTQGAGRLVLQQGRQDGAEHHADAGPAGSRVQEDGPRLARRARLPQVGSSARMASITSLRPRAARAARGRGPARRRARSLLSGDALRARRRDARLRRAARRRRRVAHGRGRARSAAILGSNGAGKTTLFNAITGDFPPTAGRIHFFGEDITDAAAARAHPQGPAAHLPVLAAVSRPDGARQPLPRGARRRQRPLQLPGARARGARVDRRDQRPARARAPDRTSPTSASPTWRTASSASSRSAWRWPARRA